MSSPGPRPWYRLPAERTVRGLLLAVSLVVFMASCGEEPAGLSQVAVDGPDAPRIDRIEPTSGSPAGIETLTITGKNLGQVQVVWVGEAEVYRPTEATSKQLFAISADGTTLTIKAPATRAGALLDVGVGRVDAFGEKVEQRAVLPRAFSTSGLPRWGVGVLAVVIALLAFLGTPLYIVITAITCLGLYLESQLKADRGFFTSPGDQAGLGSDIYISWLPVMGDSPLFIAIPLFTLAGALMSESKTPERLIGLCRALFGWMPGGLALVTIVTCCFFTAFTGASGVTIIALGGLLYPVLLRERYPERFTIGLLMTGGSLGLLFPPSLPVIIYGLVARVDVGRLFQAAFVPGILLIVVLFLTSVAAAVRAGTPRQRFDAREVLRATRAAMWELPLPVIVIGGIYKGIVTAAEASAVTAFYVVLLTVVVHRDIKVSALAGIVRRTAVLVGALLFIIGAALGFTSWLTTEGIPQTVLAFMQSRLADRTMFLLALNLFLLVAHLDIFSAILVYVPLIIPVALEFGVDPYHLAVIFLVNLEIGYCTPPLGLNLFIAALRFRRPVTDMYRSSLLFIAVLFVALMLITYFPVISLGVFDGLPAVAVTSPDGAPVSSISVVQYAPDAPKLTVVVKLGEADIGSAKASLEQHSAALAARERETGLVWADLDREARRGESQRDTGKTPAERQAGGEAMAAAQKKLEPLRAVATGVADARRLITDLGDLARTVRWRSRTTGTEQTGAEFEPAAFPPGDHVVAVTAVDKRGHVAQSVIHVHVDPAPEPPPGEGGDDWGGGGWDAPPDDGQKR